ncbi:putative avra10-like protein [Erysiphe necator]|uniref:Putative avra10-like protein n=1 Tax=Uncinula necator TaxID=52586 RepID=A0A0B1NZ29_UNCNE|nr:putative avra10-like protein [Erysiphe necator]
MAWLGTEECMTSDHLPICGFVPNPKEKNLTRSDPSGKLRVAKENIPRFTRIVSQWLPPLTPLRTIEETENFAQDLCRTLENALKAVGKRPNKKSGRSATWWTSECKTAQLEYKEALEETERVTLVWAFRNTVASAKREH